MTRLVDVESFTMTTDKDTYKPGETIHIQCYIKTGYGYSTNARIVIYGITTKIKTFTIYPNTEQYINIDVEIPSYTNPGTYTLTAELDEYFEGGGTPI